MARLLLGLPFAALVTGVLFIVMYGFVRPGEVEVTPKKDPPVISIFADVDPPEARTRDREIEVLVDAPPPPSFTPAGLSDADRVPLPSPTPGPVTVGPGDFRGPVVALPIATVPPQYPARCQASGTEGYAVVRFDVTANGQVVNAEVTERSHACFERAALQAIRSWRYQPAPGQSGIIARGLTKRFSFDLNEA